ncbi:hypothetical protein MABM_51320 (plasmid) [Mycobacteroides abscessus]|nr:hypothetical protein MABM_51320 [Mycobacteroides abscessus]
MVSGVWGHNNTTTHRGSSSGMTVINIDPRVRALIGLSAVAAWVKAPSNDELAAAVLEVVNEPTTEDGINTACRT